MSFKKPNVFPGRSPLAWSTLRLLASSSLIVFLCFLGVGCHGAPDSVEIEDGNQTSETPSESEFEALALAAVASSNRPEADLEDDAARKPAEVLAFSQVQPGMRVLDVLAGTGYYTELLSTLVGETGEVLCHNNPAYLSFMGESYEERFANDRLPNVTRINAEVDDLSLDDGSLDAVVFVLGYHDTYFEPPDGSWPTIDQDALLNKFHAALKPGGVVLVIDHAAAPGGDAVEVATTLHRIDPVAVLADFEKAGFVLDGESHTLRNSEDTKTINVFDPTMRRKTDRFIYRFRKG